MPPLPLAILIDLPETQPYFIATLAALYHAAATAASLDIQPKVIRTDHLDQQNISDYAAIVVGPGSPYRNPDAVHAAIRTAREQGIPLVGT